MGFRINVEDNADQITDFLLTDPSTLFKENYIGYILFLFTEDEKENFEWIINKSKTLDSLTADILAYGIFVKKFSMKLRLSNNNNNNLKEKVSRKHNLSLDKIKMFESVERLVKRGYLGKIKDGDEITAITYAVDEIAKELGIVDKLPCIVLIDMKPNKDFEVIPINKSQLDLLIKVLRSVIQGLLTNNKSKELISNIESIKNKKKMIIYSKSNIKYYKSKILEYEYSNYLRLLHISEEHIRKYLKLAKIKKFIKILSNFKMISNVEAIIYQLENKKSVFIALRIFLLKLEKYKKNFTYNLLDENVKKIVLPLIEKNTFSNKSYISRIKKIQTTEIDKIINLINESGLYDKLMTKSIRQINQSKDELFKEKNTLKELVKEYRILNKYIDDNDFSFIKEFKKYNRIEKRELKMTNIKNHGISYIKKIVEPDFVKKIVLN